MATTSSRRKQQGEVNDKGKINDNTIEMFLIESLSLFPIDILNYFILIFVLAFRYRCCQKS